MPKIMNRPFKERSILEILEQYILGKDYILFVRSQNKNSIFLVSFLGWRTTSPRVQNPDTQYFRGILRESGIIFTRKLSSKYAIFF